MSITYKQRADFHVEVVRWDGTNTEEVEAFVNSGLTEGSNPIDKDLLAHDPEIQVPHLNRDEQDYLIFVQANGMTEKVLPNDYIVREGEKDYYVYSPDLFVAKYELTEGLDEPVGWYSKNTPEKVYAVQYTGRNVKQVADFVHSSRLPAMDPDTLEIAFSLAWTLTCEAKPGDYIAKTNYGVRVIDRDEFRRNYQYIIPVVDDEPDPEPEPEPEIADPPEPTTIHITKEMSKDEIDKLCQHWKDITVLPNGDGWMAQPITPAEHEDKDLIEDPLAKWIVDLDHPLCVWDKNSTDARKDD